MSIGAAIMTLGPALLDIVRKFIPDADKAREAETEVLNTLTAANDRLGDAMKIDAQSADKFQSRWRPALGWIGVIGCGLEFLIFPLVNMTRQFFDLTLIESTLDSSALTGMVATVLGIGTLRTVEKYMGKTK